MCINFSHDPLSLFMWRANIVWNRDSKYTQFIPIDTYRTEILKCGKGEDGLPLITQIKVGKWS